ncbi:MAG: nickel insertion protein, partial [Actinomycetota bacterium]
MRVAYFDCFAGISGAMSLAALVDAGADLNHVGEVLGGLRLMEFTFERERVETVGMTALRLHVRSAADTVIRTYSSLRATLDEANLPDRVRLTAQRAFRLLAEADARVHGREVDLVTFHDSDHMD